MTLETKHVKRVCKCENCGNEAEMLITCTLESPRDHHGAKENEAEKGAATRVKGTGTCASCGNEADIWVDL